MEPRKPSVMSATDATKLYGPSTDKTEGKFMQIMPVPDDIKAGFKHVKNFPVKFYVNKDAASPLLQALRNLMSRGLAHEMKTWDGLFNRRAQRGSTSPSMHSWGLAFDVNAAENVLGGTPHLSAGFVSAIKDAGFDWGGEWTRKDGMHFQLKKSFAKEK